MGSPGRPAGPGGQAPSSPGCCFPSNVRSLPVPGSPRQPPQAPVANTGTIRSLGWLMQIVQEMQNSLTRKEQREQCISPSDGVKKFALLGKDWECSQRMAAVTKTWERPLCCIERGRELLISSELCYIPLAARQDLVLGSHSGLSPSYRFIELRPHLDCRLPPVRF